MSTHESLATMPIENADKHVKHGSNKHTKCKKNISSVNAWFMNGAVNESMGISTQVYWA